MVRLEDLQVFVAAVEAGSFSAASRVLNLTPAVASTAMKRLERELDVRLFVRSTRSLRLTDEGERYLSHARLALKALEDGRMTVARKKGGLTGILKLSVPSDFGRNVLLPWLDEFQDQFPKLTVQMRVSDRVADLYRQPVDVAIRYGVLEDSTLVSQPLAPTNRRVLCAAPAYLARHGAPESLEGLRRHNCLRFTLGDVVHDRWAFHGPQGAEVITVDGNRFCDDADVVRRWALAGQGLVYKSFLDLAGDLQAGRLVPVLPEYRGEATPLHLVCAHRSLLSPAVARLRDFLKARCEALLATMEPLLSPPTSPRR
ncbi:LysR family transcriptional regulator [Stigmatella erecta]|uniref:Transcriptional regulator, LysR family n=1 Tax=Stigmatella erecta TaxID=83460 RepID=A0A1I0EV89_9BACT|nr:LysR family transcriptional regulator [Stigmatella erecta]SET48802.1 transcriptional regulator, LysR family [Stigmatella erecta]